MPQHYPVVSDHFRMVARNVEEVRDKEQREDLKKLAQVWTVREWGEGEEKDLT